MMPCPKILLALLFSCTTVVAFAQEPSVRWYKGNTHAHSYWSDGNDFSENVVEWYKTHGYDFICLSEHNILADVDFWKPVSATPPPRMVKQIWYDRYLEKYGKNWVVYKTDSSGLQVKLKKLSEYAPLFAEKNKFLIMPAEELSATYGGKPIHMCYVNIRYAMQPLTGSSKTDVIQKNLDQLYQQRKNTGQPMFAHINHPNYKSALSLADLLPIEGVRFFEVYNGHPLVDNYGDSAAMSTEDLWDRLLINDVKTGKPLIYGVGTEDSHEYHDFRVGMGNPGRGWIMVKANELSPAAIVDAMEKGDFYATTGVELSDVTFKNRVLKIDVKPVAGVNYTIQFWGAEKLNDKGVLLSEQKGDRAQFKKKNNILFVRAKIISSRPKENPFRKGDVETAWTQPVR